MTKNRPLQTLEFNGWLIVFEAFHDGDLAWYALQLGRGHSRPNPLFAGSFRDLFDQIGLAEDAYRAKRDTFEASVNASPRWRRLALTLATYEVPPTERTCMSRYPFRKFVVIEGHRDAEVGHLVSSHEHENYHHIDLIECSMKKNLGIDINQDPEAIPDDTTSGWLHGDGRTLTLAFVGAPTPRLKVHAHEALARWAGADFTIRTVG